MTRTPQQSYAQSTTSPATSKQFPTLMSLRDMIAPVGAIRANLRSPSPMAEESDSKNERRSQSRGKRRLPIRFFDPNQRASYQGILINGSDGGAFIETNETLPLLTKIRIEGPGVVFHAQVCRVHWLGPEERGTRSGGMAVRLLDKEMQFEDADYEDESGAVLSIGNAKLVNG